MKGRKMSNLIWVVSLLVIIWDVLHGGRATRAVLEANLMLFAVILAMWFVCSLHSWKDRH